MTNKEGKMQQNASKELKNDVKVNDKTEKNDKKYLI